VKTEKIAIVVVMVYTTDDDVDSQSGIENKLHALYILATMTMGGRVRRRAVTASRNWSPVNHLFRTRCRY
jgi:hypothetical protein